MDYNNVVSELDYSSSVKLHTVDRKVGNSCSTVTDGIPTSADLSWLWSANPLEKILKRTQVDFIQRYTE